MAPPEDAAANSGDRAMLHNPSTDAAQPCRQPSPAIDLVPDSWGPKDYGSVADVALTRRGPDAIQFTADAHFLLVLLTPQPRREIRIGSSRPSLFAAPAGSVEIIPACADFEARWDVSKENILLSIDPERLSIFAAREFDADAIEMRPAKAGTADRTATQIAALLRDYLAQPERGMSKLYADALNTAMLLHFLRTHSSLADRPAPDRFRGGIGPGIWRDLEAFILVNLASDLTLGQLAARAGLSYSHFQRAFRQTTGLSPHRFIMLHRANRARELARSPYLPLKQIALDCGFSSQSHMTTVMKALLNQTPGEIRREAGVPSDDSES